MERNVTIALAQNFCEMGDLERNLQDHVRMIREAGEKNADIVCFCELGGTGYRQDLLGQKLYDLAEDPADGPTIRTLGPIAKEQGMYVIAPVVIADPEGRVHEDGLAEGKPIVYNSVMLIDREGQLAGTYSKNHAFDTEQKYFALGDDMPVFDTDFGTIGIMICFDMGLPETARILALKGAEIIFVPSAWRIEDELMWDVNTQCRALENRVFLAAVNRVGREGDELLMFGKSKVVDYDGRVIAEAHRFREEVITTTVDLGKLEFARFEVPYIARRKPQNYDILCDQEV